MEQSYSMSTADAPSYSSQTVRPLLVSRMCTDFVEQPSNKIPTEIITDSRLLQVSVILDNYI